MDKLQTKARESAYREYDIEGDKGRISDILREMSALENIDGATSDTVLVWPQREKSQRMHKEALDIIKEAKTFTSVRCITQT